MPRCDQGHAVTLVTLTRSCLLCQKDKLQRVSVTKATNYNPVFVFVVVVVKKKGDAQTVHVPFYGEPAEVISSLPPSFYRL